ncbi:hypothetical protein D9756_003660 [Leucocoprinus leucothites]|uniref:Mannoprotein n=1 Tax=Leucocoprinus leucothites TaxID=201217 RepID=A0A8H5G6V0_9AGAR|nr:hypothetical protein D9756_003660 [Leucoagaricus leucothites]
MLSRGFSSLVGLAACVVSVVNAQEITGTYPATPLASKTSYTYPSGVPYKVDTDTGLIRGVQAGYNICNSTTENQDSLCQTSVVGDIEGEMVAWCTKPGRGTRLIPDTALQGVQFMKTPDYVQVVGFINQSLIDMDPLDYGGEMDPHGADLRGNPMGGIIFSQSFNGQWVQVHEWHNFMGSNTFCLKACDPSRPDDARYCEHIFDRIGCAYNAPNNAQNGTFESCEGENQDFPGVYTENGVVVTYTQPPEALGPIGAMPYTARVPASSNCVTHTSAAIYTGLPQVAGVAGSSGSGTATSRPTGSVSGSGASSSSTSSAERGVAVGTVKVFGAMMIGTVISYIFA